jgi:hypothetical protein
MIVRSALMQLRAQAILVSFKPRPASFARRFKAEEAVSTLTALHHKTKLHFTEADSVSTLQCKRAEEGLQGKTSNSEDATDNQKEKQVLSHTKQVTRSKK